jgi:hypothetical protein
MSEPPSTRVLAMNAELGEALDLIEHGSADKTTEIREHMPLFFTQADQIAREIVKMEVASLNMVKTNELNAIREQIQHVNTYLEEFDAAIREVEGQLRAMFWMTQRLCSDDSAKCKSFFHVAPGCPFRVIWTLASSVGEEDAGMRNVELGFLEKLSLSRLIQLRTSSSPDPPPRPPPPIPETLLAKTCHREFAALIQFLINSLAITLGLVLNEAC